MEHEKALKSVDEKHKLELESSVSSSKQELAVKLTEMDRENTALQVRGLEFTI